MNRTSTKFQKLQQFYQHNRSFTKSLYNKSYFRGPSPILLKKAFSFTATALENVSEKQASKDIIRVAAIYGMCGTVCSYFDINFNGKLIYLKWSVPTPERFLLHVWCWGMAGSVSWFLFWSRPHILIRAAAARVRFGLTDGARTSIIAMTTVTSALSFFSIYFDYIDYRTRRNQYHASLTPSLLAQIDQSNNESGIGSPNGVLPPTDPIISEENDDEEEDDDEDEVTNNASNVLISNKLFRKKNNKKNKKNDQINMKNKMTKPYWDWDHAITHVYQPCKMFMLCNGAIWLLFGSVTGIIATRVMTQTILRNGMSAAMGLSFGSLLQCQFENTNLNQNMYEIMIENSNNYYQFNQNKIINENDLNRELKLKMKK